MTQELTTICYGIGVLVGLSGLIYGNPARVVAAFFIWLTTVGVSWGVTVATTLSLKASPFLCDPAARLERLCATEGFYYGSTAVGALSAVFVFVFICALVLGIVRAGLRPVVPHRAVATSRRLRR